MRERTEAEKENVLAIIRASQDMTWQEEVLALARGLLDREITLEAAMAEVDALFPVRDQEGEL